ncbi:MAG: MarR family transcriptional regulator, partial [Promethearchaeota archaeon]
TYEGSPVSYLLDLLSTRIMKPDFDSSFLTDIALELDLLMKTDDQSERFNDFVCNLILHDEIQREVRTIALQELGHAFEVGSFSKDVLTFKLDTKVATFFSTFNKIRLDSSNTRNLGENHTAKYLQLKDEYFQSFRETLSPLFRASLKNYSLVLHEVLIEECSTQESIEKSTKLPQSTISELLKQLIGEGYIVKKRIKGHRRVHYYPKASLTSLILHRFDRLNSYSSTVLINLEDILSMVKNSKSKNAEKFRSTLSQIKMGNLMLQQYSDRMRNLTKQKIYEKYHEGFHLI